MISDLSFLSPLSNSVPFYFFFPQALYCLCSWSLSLQSFIHLFARFSFSLVLLFSSKEQNTYSGTEDLFPPYCMVWTNFHIQWVEIIDYYPFIHLHSTCCPANCEMLGGEIIILKCLESTHPRVGATTKKYAISPHDQIHPLHGSGEYSYYTNTWLQLLCFPTYLAHLQHIELVNIQAEASGCVINHSASVICSHAIHIHTTSSFVTDRRKDVQLIMLYGHATLTVYLEVSE